MLVFIKMLVVRKQCKDQAGRFFLQAEFFLHIVAPAFTVLWRVKRGRSLLRGSRGKKIKDELNRRKSKGAMKLQVSFSTIELQKATHSVGCLILAGHVVFPESWGEFVWRAVGRH